MFSEDYHACTEAHTNTVNWGKAKMLMTALEIAFTSDMLS